MPETIKADNRKMQAEKRRREILDAALKIFAEQGYQGATISQISETAGTSLGLLYHYFPNKKALMEAVIAENSFLPMLKNIQTVLTKLCLEFYRLLENKKELVSVFLREGTSNPTVRQVWFGMLAQGALSFKIFLDQYVERGVLKAHSTDISARSLMSATVMLYLTNEAFGEGFAKPAEFITQMVANQLSGIEIRQKE
ncbi:MAG: TetR family transcriptional regulator [Dehalococcoides mccartyi]|uniref:TetR/AcrR family transcriptional regulator n=1 Tax=Dehalococcoides TaxID=61434 RepID=UPI00080498F2|nr:MULTISPECIES: TetR/AcrR family transcriptional regulator [Dehalococcoides]OBW61415.1 MAG: TetR family transcriptional regulator [Dehalococcoides mccartyi]